MITIYKPTTLDGRYSINTNAFYQATGAAQSALGSLTGSQADKVNDPPRLTHYSRQSLTTTNQNQAEQKKAEAEARKDISHAGANIGGFSVSAQGVAENDPNRSAGSWNQTVGAGKEALGGALGLEGMRKAGEQQQSRKSRITNHESPSTASTSWPELCTVSLQAQMRSIWDSRF